MPIYLLKDRRTYATNMGIMLCSQYCTKDNASYLFFEGHLGSESFDMHSEKDMNVSVENDKRVTIDGNCFTVINKGQQDTMVGNATFHYKAKRDTTVDDVESNTFNNSQTTKLKNGRKLEIINDGDESKITGDQTLKLQGSQIEHIAEKKKITIGEGFSLEIMAGGKKQKSKVMLLLILIVQ
ncbi:hypothetical protein FJU30_03600 [Affinibrenneria salicis]|uniref:Gp5/Type VI secretion system Vgr C-terminal trimerisation domain-containing protein n=1 Tax=Affinibrenneria salicis TaxID=2590031 RepID=A0A5J5G616_9GAMM|nr:hypothetical protein [Affinibrenneria salicis]KAA9002637.1 hypothetical protein FJU30_01165 [Affinibrenneria salicis]KAA9003075.1 hypothetical protein FJU30_03600 [Affinibrenneria salicis]